MKGSIDSPLPLSVKNVKNGVVQIGPLIIQTMQVYLKWRKVTVYNYPMAFPHGVFTLWAQGIQIGDPGTNALYSAGASIQVANLSNSQFKAAVSSDVANSDMSVMVYAIGY